MKKHFDEIAARRKSYLDVEFVVDSISLDIPMPDGINVQEWNLAPLVPPKVQFLQQLDCEC